MKKIGCLIALFLGLVLSASATGGFTVVSGHINRENTSSVILYEVIEGKRVEYASTKLDANQDFAFALQSVKEGFYYISTQSKKDFTRIYLIPGEQLNLQIGEDGYELIKGSAENKLLYQWYKTAEVITEPAFNWMKDTSTYLSFFPKLEKFLPQVSTFKSKIKTKNSHFNELMNLAVDMDVEHAAMYFLLTPNTIHPKKEDYPACYATIIQPGKYKSAALLQLGEGAEIIMRYSTFYLLYTREKYNREDYPAKALARFGNDTIRGLYLSNSLGGYKTFEAVEEAVGPYKQYLVTDTMKAAYFRALKGVAEFKKGSPAYNFAYEDQTGKKIALKDLRGKVVMVDVWATWCGPCKVEIPHLKKLEEEMKGKNVEFVSISVDVEKDKEKWKNMVTDQQLGGTQLFASGWSDIAKYYNITGIPRFLVFDQEGKIISADAPRPSDPALKKLLDDTLEGK